jgi:ankyrin repeat protein
MQKFLQLGLNINTRNNAGETPLFTYFATIAPHDDPTRHRKYISVFINAGADIFARENEGRTLLHVLAKRVEMAGPRYGGNGAARKRVSFETPPDVVDCYMFLVEQGLDPMTEDANLITSLDVATAYDNKGILELSKGE